MACGIIFGFEALPDHPLTGLCSQMDMRPALFWQLLNLENKQQMKNRR